MKTKQINFVVTEEQKKELEDRYYAAVGQGFRGSQSEYFRQMLLGTHFHCTCSVCEPQA